MNTVDIDATTRGLIFNGVLDTRYTLPMWSAMSSRGCRVFFHCPRTGAEAVIGGRFHGVLEALTAALTHRTALTE